LLVYSNKSRFRHKLVFSAISRVQSVTENDTPEIVLRIRIKSLPARGEFDEYDLRPYRVGGTYELPTRLATLLILGGYAESAARHTYWEAADYARRNKNER
jgi:hypothetical protein